MSKKIRMLATAAVLTLPLWAATTASAGPDCDNPKFTDHPLCATSAPDSGTTCAGSVEDGHQVSTENDGFEIVVDPGSVGCVDWTTTIETNWLVTVDPGNASSVYLNVRGSHPGDFCWVDSLDSQDLKSGLTALTITHSDGPLADDGPLPVSTVGACGEKDDNAESFVFTVGSDGRPSKVTVTVTAIVTATD